MTRKDYELIAKALKQEIDHYNGLTEYSVNRKAGAIAAACMVASHLAGDNPRFNHKMFLKAAGVTE